MVINEANWNTTNKLKKRLKKKLRDKNFGGAQFVYILAKVIGRWFRLLQGKKSVVRGGVYGMIYAAVYTTLHERNSHFGIIGVQCPTGT